ncbi:orotate phosphoribosyltransferase [Methanobacterium sp. ACI-7]
MEISGLCNICGKPGKMYTCSLCGSLICRECYDQSKGVCKPCKKNPGKRI